MDEIESGGAPPPAALQLPKLGGSWTLAELEEIAAEAAARSALPETVAIERKRRSAIRTRADELVKAGTLSAEAAREISDELIARGVAIEQVGNHFAEEIAQRAVNAGGEA